MKLKPAKRTARGETRVLRRFALLPTETEDGHRVWLEWVYVVETFFVSFGVMPNAWWGMREYFVDSALADREAAYRVRIGLGRDIRVLPPVFGEAQHVKAS